MHVIVPLCVVTRSNTLVDSCEYVCFVLGLIYSFILWMYFSMCLVLADVYWHVPYSDAIDAETESVEWMCMYVASHTCPRLFSGDFSRPPNTTDLPSTRMTCCTNRHIAHDCIVVPHYCCILTPMVSQISFDYFTTNFKSSALSRKCFRLNLHR